MASFLSDNNDLIYKIIFIIGISVCIQSFLALYNFVQLSKADSILNALGSLKGNTGNINIFSASLSIKIPFLLIGILHFTKWEKWFLVFALLVATLLVFLTGSRAAFLSLFFETIVFIVFYLKLNPLNRKNISSLLYIIIPIVISFFVTNQIFEKGKGTGRYESVSSRVKQVADLKDASVNTRLLYWNNALEMIKNNPLIGIGLGNWQIESVPYEKKIENDYTVSGHAHNDFLQITAETGILNGLIYLSLFIYALYLNLKRFFKFENYENRKIALLSILLLLSYGIDATFNFPLYRPTMQVWFSFFLALSIINTSTSNESEINYFSNKASVFIIIISLFTVFFSFKTLKANQLENDIKANFLTGKFTLKAGEIIYNLPKYPNVLTTGEPFTSYVGKYFIEEGNFNQANKYLNIGNSINPYIGRTEFYKTIIAAKSGKNDSAFLYAKKALEIRPRNKTYYAATINSAIILKDTLGILEVHNLYAKYRSNPEIWINTSSALNQSNYENNKLIYFINKGLMQFPNDSLLIERQKLFKNNSILQKREPFIIEATNFYNDGKYNRAIESFQKALNVDSQKNVLFQNIAVFHYNLKHYKNAISYFKKSLIAPNLKDGKSEYLMGLSYFFIKDKENGCKYLNLAKNKNYGDAQEIFRQKCK